MTDRFLGRHRDPDYWYMQGCLEKTKIERMRTCIAECWRKEDQEMIKCFEACAKTNSSSLQELFEDWSRCPTPKL